MSMNGIAVLQTLPSCVSPPLHWPIWVSHALDCSTTHRQYLFTYQPLQRTTVANTHYLSPLACAQSLCRYLRPITLDLQLGNLL